jgi:glyoxylase-like metal-dependent hydrolase (beta-lactamase superfamily II)
MMQLRVLEPHPNVLAFYDGRVPGYRFASGSNWVDDGALSLGIASYAIIDGSEALVYDTHVSVPHAQAIREVLAARGVRRFTVALSHWHLDHVAGNEVFAGCEIIACNRTAENLAAHRSTIEAGTYDGPPPIRPLVMPSRTFEGRLSISIGNLTADLLQFDIHSDDGVVVWLGQDRLLLAGDTLEDTVTYVAEPDHLSRHLPELDRLAGLSPARILPNHGSSDRIASGGYGHDLIAATARYVGELLAMKTKPERRTMPLGDLVADDVRSGALEYFEGYEAVHQRNIACVLAT